MKQTKKYAILIIETGEYIYSLSGLPTFTFRSTEEVPKYGGYSIMLFNSKESALNKLLNEKKDNAWVLICGKSVSTKDNIELFEIVEMPND